MSATGLGSATGGASGIGTGLCVEVEEDDDPWADNEKEKDDDEEGSEEGSEEGDDENDDEEDFEFPANTAAPPNNNKDSKDNRGNRTKRPPSILTSNARPGSINSAYQKCRTSMFSENTAGCYDDRVHNTPQ